MTNRYHVYMLECADGTLYTGITNRIKERIAKHQAGKGARYTRSRLPVRLRYLERGEGKSWALKREHELRQLSRQQKWQLIAEKGGQIYANPEEF
ncbi:putative endonuclease [Seinonella peptonophila]|uniref:Putative endonuclease n=1 Tax=Seinonella peptonophila TaxID=112248 RepID=A0A1M4YKU2_9BACL|nr:GIY-YIG nuclease family protein [Seinonella peptonophila]SHF06293.1 putative endonuclease [Seinonella peptonophila]